MSGKHPLAKQGGLSGMIDQMQREADRAKAGRGAGSEPDYTLAAVAECVARSSHE